MYEASDFVASFFSNFTITILKFSIAYVYPVIFALLNRIVAVQVSDTTKV